MAISLNLKVKKSIFFLCLTVIFFSANLFLAAQQNHFNPPNWSYNAIIYEVNIRQYSEEGTFQEFEKHLPRLNNLGVGILWFMPVHPIGEVNRKGTLGSYYSVKDYKAVNPEFGNIEDFKNVVKHAHKLGMKVIIDWVANHTAWDHSWMKTKPEFYTKDEKGNYVSPFDWSDVVDLNFENKELWNEMRDAMKFWVDECDIDGFRCDVAAMVPIEFWTWVRPQLEKNKTIFMLAEAHEPELHQAFDMTYNWQLKDLFVDIAQGKKSAKDLYEYFENEKTEYPKDAFRMVFTTNHDENSWNGTDKERFGPFAETFAVLTGVVNGMQLIYSGQEAGLDKRLDFFERDPIVWNENKMQKIYTTLAMLKKQNKALRNGNLGGAFEKIEVNENSVFAFSRTKDKNRVIALFNLSDSPKTLTITDSNINGKFEKLFEEDSISIKSGWQISLKPYEYVVLYQ